MGNLLGAVDVRKKDSGGLEYSVDRGVTWAPVSAGGSTWFDVEAAAHVAAIPQLTESVALQLGPANVGELIGANLADAGKEGGAIKSTGTAWALLMRTFPWQAANTSKIACSFRGILGAPVTTKQSDFGLVRSDGAGIQIATNFDTNNTQFFAQGYTGAALTAPVLLGVADTLVHTWRILSDGATVTFQKDGVTVGTLATNAVNFPTNAICPGIFDNVPGTAQGLYKVLYSFVGT